MIPQNRWSSWNHSETNHPPGFVENVPESLRLLVSESTHSEMEIEGFVSRPIVAWQHWVPSSQCDSSLLTGWKSLQATKDFIRPSEEAQDKESQQILGEDNMNANNDEDVFSSGGFWLACIFPGLSRALRIFEVWKCNKKPAKVQIGRIWMAWAYSWGSKISRNVGRECSLPQQPASGCRGRKSHGCLHRGDATLQAQTIFRSALAEAWHDIGSYDSIQLSMIILDMYLLFNMFFSQIYCNYIIYISY